MAMVGRRRFVNIVAAGKYKTGLLSVHRLDVSEHLFYPSASEARSATKTSLPAQEHDLPVPCAVFFDATTAAAPARRRSTAFFSLVSPRSSDGSRILFTNEAGDSMMYDADDKGCHAMPSLEEFAGPVAASVSVVVPQAGGGGGGAAKEESMYVMHGMRNRVARFDVLRFGRPPTTTKGRNTRDGEGWYWQSLPPPPFVSDDIRYAVISSYTVVEGGRTICVSASTAGAWPGTWCFDTVRGEWWHAGDWDMPFEGRAEYLPDLDLCLGFSACAKPGRELCTTSGLSSLAMAMNQTPTCVWRDDHTPMPKLVELISLGSGRFAIVKVFNLDHGYTSDFSLGDIDYMGEDNELLDIIGVEIRPRHDSCDVWSCSDDGLELIPHKSIGFVCDTQRIYQVL